MKLRILVADDSSLARSMLREILEADPGISVVGEARDGREAVELAKELEPDLVTMDLRMPILDGIGAITEIMATRPLPILVVSSASDAEDAYVAVQRGALEVLGKPDFSEASRAELVSKVRTLANARVITHLRTGPAAAPSGPGSGGSGLSPGLTRTEGAGIEAPTFAIAASTGGPQALARILSGLPAGFPGPVLIAQHISDGFAPGLVQWLSTICKLPVRLAVGGEFPLPGEVYISPSERNLAFSPTRKLVLLDPAERQIFHPVCDILLSSVATACGRRAVGIILTGMSEDGVRGMDAIRQAGGRTLAQDEASSVVFGMNKLAIERGAITKILPIDDFPSEMCRIAAEAAVKG